MQQSLRIKNNRSGLSPLLTILLITIFTLLFINSCSNTIVSPEDQPGRRDYEWTIDTLRIFNNNIWGIWGSTPDDIWGVGPGTFPVWHYNGKRWDSLGYAPGNIYSPNCIYGFAKNDVWIAGSNGRIYHYNGNEWSLNYQHTINGFIGIDFYNLYGTSSNDLYAVGTVWFDNETRRGIILHYNGSSWDQKFLADFNSYFYKVRASLDKRCFIHCIKQDVQYNSRDTTVFYEFDGKRLQEIYTDADKPLKRGWLSAINGNAIFSIYTGIYKYVHNSFQPLVKYDIQTPPGAVFGRNEKDIFSGTSQGIAHFNGTDVQLILPTEGWLSDGIMFNNQVVFLRSGGQNGDYIYHGKLKE